MEREQLLEWFLKTLLGAGVVHIMGSLKDLKKSVDGVNAKMERIDERSDWQKEENKRVDHRLTRLEEARGKI